MAEIFVVLDLETTGLDPESDFVLEVGALHIDFRTLEVLSRLQVVAGMGEKALFSTGMNDYVRNMHLNSGLLTEILEGPARSQASLDYRLSAWFRGIGAQEGSRDIVLCGNSIHFDRGFLQSRLPGAFELLSHRVVDTSALRTCYKQWCGEAPKEDMKHRSIADCEASLQTLRWAQDIFRRGQPEITA